MMFIFVKELSFNAFLHDYAYYMTLTLYVWCISATCVYAIMARLEINWAKIIFDTLVREPTTSLPYGASLSHIFKKFKIDLASETNAVKSHELFAKSILLRMKLLETLPPQPTHPSQNS